MEGNLYHFKLKISLKDKLLHWLMRKGLWPKTKYFIATELYVASATHQFKEMIEQDTLARMMEENSTPSTIPMDFMAYYIPECPLCQNPAVGFETKTGQGHGEAYSEVGIKCTRCSMQSSIGGYFQHEVKERFERCLSDWILGRT